MRPRGSIAADSPSVYIGRCTGARSRDLDLCRLPELPVSSSDTGNRSWISIGCIGGTGGVCGTGIGGVRGTGIVGVCGACAEGCTRSRDLDHSVVSHFVVTDHQHRHSKELDFSCVGGRGRHRSRGTFSALALPLPPAGERGGQSWLNGSSRGGPRQWIHHWPQRCQNRDGGCYITGSSHSAKSEVEGLPHVGKNPSHWPMDSREGSFVSFSRKICICSLRSGRLQLDFSVNCM